MCVYLFNLECLLCRLFIVGPLRKTHSRPESSLKKFEGYIENKSCSTTVVDPKIVAKPYPDPENSPLGPQKVKNDPKIK